MRIANKIGMGLIVLFLCWFSYTFYTYQEAAKLIPLFVGLFIAIPCFILYFLFVYLYRNYPYTRKLLWAIPVILFIYYILIETHYPSLWEELF